MSKRPRWKTAMGINKAFFCQVSGWYSGYLLWGVNRGLWQWLVAGGLPMLLIQDAFLTPSLCEHLNSYPIASALSHRFKYNRFYIFIDKRLSFLWVPECIWGYLVAKFWVKCIALIKGHSYTQADGLFNCGCPDFKSDFMTPCDTECISWSDRCG